MSSLFAVLLLASLLFAIGLTIRYFVNRHQNKSTQIKGVGFKPLMIGAGVAFIVSVIGVGATSSTDAATNQSSSSKPLIAITAKQRRSVASQKSVELKRSKSLATKYEAAEAASQSLAKVEESLSDKAAAAESISEKAARESSAAAESRSIAVASSRAASSSTAKAQSLAASQSQSTATAAAARTRTTTAAAKPPVTSQGAGDVVTGRGSIIGNVNSKIYHVPGQAGYHMSSTNAVYFKTEQEAINAGYRRAKR